MKNLINFSQKLSLLAGVLVLVAASAHAKLPPLSDEAQVKATDAAAKTSWSGKVDAFKLCRAQDRIAAAYQTAAKAGGMQIKPPLETPACSDPGSYVAAVSEPPKPIEASGAHSPAETATSPPSTTQPAAMMPAAAIPPVKKP